jgi:arginine deiminase
MVAVHILDLEIARGENTRLTSLPARFAFVVTFDGSALVRGGGPRCLTMPIEQESVA